MTVSLVFNELSLLCPAPNRHTAREWMTELTKTLKTAVDHDVTVLRMRDNFGDLLLSPNYPMQAWFDDGRVSPEERLFVLTFTTQYRFIRPYDEDLRNDQEFQSRKLLFEGKFKGRKADGLGHSFLLNGLALSILSDSSWDTPWIELDCEEIDLETGELEETRERIRHVSRPRHVSNDHSAWIDDQSRAGVRTGSDFLHIAPVRFPGLEFCDEARKQIEALTESSMHLPRVKERLFELGYLSNEWKQGNFNYRQIHNSSDESSSTMGRYGHQRRFLCPDGQRRTFRWHLKGLPLMWRIYIWADAVDRKLLVGYVGKHLETATG